MAEECSDEEGDTLVVSASPPAPDISKASKVGEEVVRAKQKDLSKKGAAASASGTKVDTPPASRSAGASNTRDRPGYTTFNREGTNKVKRIKNPPRWMRLWHDKMGSLPEPVIADWYKRDQKFVPDKAYIDARQRSQKERVALRSQVEKGLSTFDTNQPGLTPLGDWSDQPYPEGEAEQPEQPASIPTTAKGGASGTSKSVLVGADLSLKVSIPASTVGTNVEMQKEPDRPHSPPTREDQFLGPTPEGEMETESTGANAPDPPQLHQWGNTGCGGRA